MDDSMKQFYIQPYPTYIHIKDMYSVELYTELFYAIIPSIIS